MKIQMPGFSGCEDSVHPLKLPKEDETEHKQRSKNGVPKPHKKRRRLKKKCLNLQQNQ